MSSIKHLACVMDGNRRWAKKLGKPEWCGHKEGVNTVKRVVEYCVKKGISYLSLYTFSTENLNRTQEEKHYLFDVVMRGAYKSFVKDLIKNGVRARMVGDLSLFPDSVKDIARDLEKATAGGTKLQVDLLFCYGGRQELVAAARKIAQDVIDKKITCDDISQDLFEQNLWTKGVPHPEIVLRTGGHSRLSNFLLYQAAYSELHFLDCFWPELQEDHLDGVLHNFESSQRNFGK